MARPLPCFLGQQAGCARNLAAAAAKHANCPQEAALSRVSVGTFPTDAEDVLVVRRLLPAPREDVFAAWLDPVSLAQWMCPGDVERATAEVDPKVGGKFRIVMWRARSEGAEHWGEYLAIQPPSLLSFTWLSAYTDLTPTVVTIELLERGASTELILTHRRLPAPRVDAHRQGWTDIVRKLEAVVARRPT
jgi:uncharacterized protein YndB with AHSA1/START domain